MERSKEYDTIAFYLHHFLFVGLEPEREAVAAVVAVAALTKLELFVTSSLFVWSDGLITRSTEFKLPHFRSTLTVSPPATLSHFEYSSPHYQYPECEYKNEPGTFTLQDLRQIL